jgi:hypothetical protein
VKQARQLAFEFSTTINKKVPESWTKNEAAGYEWLHGFMSRNPQLALRSPQPTSLSRATSFSKTNVSKFFENLTF